MTPCAVQAEEGLVVVRHGEVEASWSIADGRVAFRRDGVLLAAAFWRNHRFVDLHALDDEVPAGFYEAICEVELILIRAERDPEIMTRARAHVAHLVRIGARSTHGIDDMQRGAIGLEVGDLHEHRVLAAVRRTLSDAPWLIRARRADADEDAAGADVVVETVDAGLLYIQVKSSLAGARRHARKHGGSDLAPRTVIAVVLKQTDAELAAGLRRSLRELYRKCGGELPVSREEARQVETEATARRESKRRAAEEVARVAAVEDRVRRRAEAEAREATRKLLGVPSKAEAHAQRIARWTAGELVPEMVCGDLVCGRRVGGYVSAWRRDDGQPLCADCDAHYDQDHVELLREVGDR